jgi:hypothetical protein
MEGNVWENSTGVRKDVRGDEEVEDVGDGGPRAEGETKEWAGGVGFDIFDDADALWLMGGDNKETDSFATPFSDGGERWPLSLASTCKEDIRG